MLKNFWQNNSALISHEINMVFFKLLEMINIYIRQIKSKINHNITVLNNLALVIVIGDFYQFSLKTS